MHTHADSTLQGQCMPPVLEYMCTNFGVDSSSRFSFVARTHTETLTQRDTQSHRDVTDHSTHASATSIVG